MYWSTSAHKWSCRRQIRINERNANKWKAFWMTTKSKFIDMQLDWLGSHKLYDWQKDHDVSPREKAVLTLFLILILLFVLMSVCACVCVCLCVYRFNASFIALLRTFHIASIDYQGMRWLLLLQNTWEYRANNWRAHLTLAMFHIYLAYNYASI